MKKFIYIFLIVFCVQLNAQQKLSSKASVTVITCGPGSVLYTTFGHSAFRIYDPVLSIDKIYNYGTFDFNAPNFYLNFAKGKLTYKLGVESFSRFLWIYNYENRWVKGQVLDLTETDVQAVFNFLENNAKPENSSYQYDFFYDNCSTKIEEIIKTVLKDNVSFSNSHINSDKSHRDLINDYTLNQKWGKFGIDLALGSVIDDKATKNEYKFLPDYIYAAFNNATVYSNKPIVKRNITFVNEKKTESHFSIYQPIYLMLLFSLIIGFITFKNYKTQKRTKFLDFSIYFVTGLIGIVVLLLWFATSHTATYKNLNFLWAFAPNLIVSFFMLKTKLPEWVKHYNWFLILLLILMILLWIAMVQVFNIALLPLIIALAIRYLFLIKKA